METEFLVKQVALSDTFSAHRRDIYLYTVCKFGYFQAENYDDKIEKALSTLIKYSSINPECRHLATKNRMYRNIILDAHLIIYRITEKRIEVLDILHAASSISRIRQSRKITIKKIL